MKKTILLADDDRDLVDALALRCRSLGLEVLCAPDGHAAAAMISQREPDLVILDVNMPAGSGLDICQLMSNDPQLAHIPVIILTGQADRLTVRKCYDLLAYYVAKCSDVWPRIEPLLYELLAIDPPAPGKQQAVPQPFEVAPLDGDFAIAESHARPWVLCIDDDRDFANSLHVRFDAEGIELRWAKTGRDGYLAAFNEGLCAILLDYEMPGANGDYTLRRLKESVATNDVPVIVISGHRDRPMQRTMYNLGASKCLPKPVDWDDLWAELRGPVAAARERCQPQSVAAGAACCSESSRNVAR